MQNPAQAKEKSPLGGEGGSCGEEDCLGRTGEDCTPGENETVDGLAANGKPLLRYLAPLTTQIRLTRQTE